MTISAELLKTFENSLCIWVTCSKNYSYVVHAGRLHKSERYEIFLKESGKSIRYNTQSKAWEEAERACKSLSKLEPCYIFKALIAETTDRYKINDLILAEFNLNESMKKLSNGGDSCI